MKTRFAPSPSGLMHPGNVRTALFNCLWARRQKGQFLLRIEDTDINSSEEHIQHLIEDLRALGLDWDFTERDLEFYRQSQRGEIYAAFYARLAQQGAAYPCFCSEDRLRLLRKRQLAAGEPPRYDGSCRALNADEVAARLRAGEKAALRLRVPPAERLEFDDLVRGRQVFLAKDLGDFIIRRSDGTASFMFANAVDDALTGIHTVIRGEDHLSNTPRQLLVLRALSLPVPHYAHISLILGNDGAPLSKRNGSRAIRELLNQGYLPLALVNYLARLGCVYSQHQLLSLEDLAANFDIKRLTRAAAKFDMRQLAHWQRLALERMTTSALLEWMRPSICDKVPPEKQEDFARIISSNILLPQEATQWALALYGEPPAVTDVADDEFWSQAYRIFTDTQNWHEMVKLLAKTSGKKGKSLYAPLRQALSGRADGPALEDLVGLLGNESVIVRLKRQTRAHSTR